METRGKKRQREQDSTSSTSTSTPRSFSAGETSAGVSAASRREKSKGVTREKKPRIDKTREKSRLDKSRKASKKPVSARKTQPAPLQSQQQSQAQQQQQQQQEQQQQQQQQQQQGAGPSDPEKRKQIQQQLVLLLHAHKCQRKEQDMQQKEYTPCSLPHCKTMKDVLNHMALCQVGRNCPYPHCASSRQIITHWRNCNRSDCQVCLPLKRASSIPRRGAGAVGGAGGGAGGGASTGQGPTGQQRGGNFPQNQVMNPMQDGGAGRPMMPSPNSGAVGGGMVDYTNIMGALPIPNISSVPTKPWHNEVTPDLRQQQVRKLVEGIYPVHNPIALQDRRVYIIIQYVMKVEKTKFESASSSKQYYELLAHVLCSIKKELDDRKKAKKRPATSVHSSTLQSNEAELKYKLHTQGGDKFVYNCNNCHMAMETRYHCRECDDFDLCVVCYKDVTHPHPMDKIGLGLELDSQVQDPANQKDPKVGLGLTNQKDPNERRKSIKKCIWFLVHATQCHNSTCKQPSCIKMKRVLMHTRECRLMLSGKWNMCTICKHFVLLLISHAKTCNQDKCPVPVCARIKKNLRDQRNQYRVRDNMFMQQRMAQMNSVANSNSTAGNLARSPQATDVTSPAALNANMSPNSTSNASPTKASPITAGCGVRDAHRRGRSSHKRCGPQEGKKYRRREWLHPV